MWNCIQNYSIRRMSTMAKAVYVCCHNQMTFRSITQVASTLHTPSFWLWSIFSSFSLFADSNRWSVRCTQGMTNNTKRRRGHSQNAVNTRHNISIENVSTSKICSETLCRASPSSTKHLSPFRQPAASSDWHWQQQQPRWRRRGKQQCRNNKETLWPASVHFYYIF